MKTIVLAVGQAQPEDDIMDLIELLKKRFTGTLNMSSAILIETDIEPVAALLSNLPTVQVDNLKKRTAKNYKCVVCGEPVSKPGIRCRSCAQNKRTVEEQA